jgi:uncharacterized membrane protein YgcG
MEGITIPVTLQSMIFNFFTSIITLGTYYRRLASVPLTIVTGKEEAAGIKKGMAAGIKKEGGGGTKGGGGAFKVEKGEGT